MRKKLISVGITIVVFAALLGTMAPVQAQLVVVQGTVYYPDGVTPAPDGVTVTVTDLDTGDSVSTTTKYGVGFYDVTFGWPQTPNSITAGDQLQVEATIEPCLANTTTVAATGTSPQIVDLTLQADDTAPTVTDLQPADGSCVNDGTPEICANYSDDQGIDTSSVTITVDGTNVTASATVTETGVCYTPGDNLGEGGHTVMVNVSDVCGNPSSTSWAFTVDTIAPAIEFNEPPTPANNSEVTVNYVNISVNVTDDGCGIDNVRLIWNGTIWTGAGFTMFRIAAGQNSFSITADLPDSFEVTDLPNGEYTYWVEANDTAGNSRMSESRVVTVNVTEYNFTLEFATGYNLISMPLKDTTVTNASALMDEIGADAKEVFKWDKAAQGWVAYNSLMPPQAAFELEGGEGYYVRMSDAASVELSGFGWESPFTVSLVTGYNLVGIPVNDTTVANASALMDEIGADAKEVFKWDKAAQGWVAYNSLMPPQAAFELEGGEGYYVRMSGTADVTFEGVPWEN